MSSANKQKGTRWETTCVNYLKEKFSEVANRIERRALSGNFDKGDIVGFHSWVLECKDRADWSKSLAQILRETHEERINANAKYGAAVIKRRQASVEQAYVVMDFETFVEVLRDTEAYNAVS
jgi:hypothetical protein|tara:strand:+ start:741 stop:1106 length:366 start_codon:yes stop_codon:yes gene_type:complete